VDFELDYPHEFAASGRRSKLTQGVGITQNAVMLERRDFVRAFL
jgi:hypothetical protein